jgi:hypothetical protein
LPKGWFEHDGYIFIPPQNGNKYTITHSLVRDKSVNASFAQFTLLPLNGQLPLTAKARVEQINDGNIQLTNLKSVKLLSPDATIREGETVAWDVKVAAASASGTGVAGSKIRISQGKDTAERADFKLTATNGVTVRDGYLWIPKGVTSFVLKLTARRDGWGEREGVEKVVLNLSGTEGGTTTLTTTIRDRPNFSMRLLSPDRTIMGGETVAWEIAVSDPAETSRRMRISQGKDSAERKDFVLSATNGVTIRDGYAYIPRGVTSFKLRVTAVVDGWGAPPGQKFRPGQGYAEGTEKLVLKLSAPAEEAKTLNVTIKESERRTVRALLKTVLPGLHGNLDGDVWAYREFQQASWFQQIKNDNLFKYINENDPDELKHFFGAASVRDISKNYTVEGYLNRLRNKALAENAELVSAFDGLTRDAREVFGSWLSSGNRIGTRNSVPDSGARVYLEDVYRLSEQASRALTGRYTVDISRKIGATGSSLLGTASRLLDTVALADMPGNLGSAFTETLKGYTQDLAASFREVARDMFIFRQRDEWKASDDDAVALVNLITRNVTAAGTALTNAILLAGAALSTQRFDANGSAGQEIARRVSDEMLGSLGFDSLNLFSRQVIGDNAGLVGRHLASVNLGSETRDILAQYIQKDLDGSNELEDVFVAFGEMSSAMFGFMEDVIIDAKKYFDKNGFFQESHWKTREDAGEEEGKLYFDGRQAYFWGEARVAHGIGYRYEDRKYYVPEEWFKVAPVVLDLDGDGFTFTSLASSVASYDANGDGERERIAWVGKRDGILSYDKNDDGLISATDEISFVGYREGAKTDLERLVAFDTNANGKLDAGDAQWGRFKVWTDTNGDGISDHGELVSLDEAGIASISLVSDKIQYEENDVTVFGTAEVERVDGTKINAADAAFAYKPNKLDARLLQLKAAIAGMAPAGQGPGSVTQEAYQRTLVGAIAAA